MTDVATLSSAARGKIASQLTAQLSLVPMSAGVGGEPNIGEAFPVVLLSSDDVRGDRTVTSIRALVREAGYWHVQVRRGEEAVMVAHAAVRSWELVNLTGAALAPAVSDAVRWIDRALPGRGIAKLLVIPDALLVAFWIVDDDRERLVIVRDDGGSGLRRRHAYSIRYAIRAMFPLHRARGTEWEAATGT